MEEHDGEEEEDEDELGEYEDLEVIVLDAKHKTESETPPLNGDANVDQQRNSLLEDSHFLSPHNHNMNNGFSEAIEILRKSGSLHSQTHKGSNGCCRDNNVQMISQV